MRPFDRDFVDESSAILRGIPTDRRPAWGSMTPPQMFAHMTAAFEYGLGELPQTPNEGGFFGALAAPLILNGFLKIPKGSKAPSMYDAAAPSATADELSAAMEAFLARLADPGFHPPAHPFFGDIGKAGWCKLSVVHLEHHLRQFKAAPANYLRAR